VLQYLFIVVSLLRHDGCTNLTKAYAVPPTGAGEGELLRNAFIVFALGIHHKRRAVEVRFRQGAPYLELFAYRHHSVGADDLQADDAPRRSTLEWFEADDLAEIDAGTFANQIRKFFLRINDFPTKEIGRFLIVIVQHLLQNMGIVRVAKCRRRTANPFVGIFFDGEIGQDKRRIQRIGFPLQVGIGYRFPHVFERFHCSATTFRKAGIANRSVIHERFAARFFNHGFYQGRRFFGNSLIALTMIVGAYVEVKMIFAVVPANEFGGRPIFGSIIVGYRFVFRGLSQQPTARNDGMRLELTVSNLVAAHFGRNHAGEVIFERNNVDWPSPHRFRRMNFNPPKKR